MKRILLFNDSLAMGGTEVLLVDLLNNFVKKGCEITLLLPMPSGKDVLLSKLSSSVSVKYIYKENESYFYRKIGESMMIYFPRFFAKRKGIEEFDYDEVICFKETFYATIFSKMKIPKVLWIHNILFKREYKIRSLKERLAVWLNKRYIKRVQKSYDRFDKVICVSEAAKSAYIDVLHGGHKPGQSIEVLYNALDLSKVIERSKEPIENLPKDRTNFILITRDSPEKRIDRLLNTAIRLKLENYDFRVCVIGDGMDSDAMKHEVEKKGLQDRITLMGRIENPFPYILQSNWSLCVSERESFSLVLLESMALKTPVITTDCGGPRNIVDNGKYGILVENNTEGVYQGMKSVLDDPSLSVRYSQQLDEAVSRFDYQGWLNKVYTILSIDSD